MKLPFLLLSLSLVIFSCNNKDQKAAGTDGDQQDTVRNFFPVTSYIKGEIYNLKQRGINPLKYITINDRTDSSWLKQEDLDSAMLEFLTPEIDSANLGALFSEKSFMDQSLNAVTLTYDPITPLPDTMQLRHWDVYINPKTQKIKRIYILKEVNKNKTLQLTWVNGQWCKITTIVTDEKGTAKVEKEEKYFWDF